ncbi:MAG: CbbQ/NirQ/NorQ C-terminal domain-containing protein [Chloroflexota bacterium]|nr:CbbQ/NirQ/NorQ C-terminal domain-containing protein [Chloroflexota bacterium]
MAQGIAPRRACQVSVNWAVTDDAAIQQSIAEIISSIFE